MSDHFFMNWLLFVGIFTVGLISPGPDFVMAVRNSIMYSRRAGIITSIGFGLAVGVHVAYCLGGLAIVISKSILLFNVIKYIGAAYLFYIGYKAIRSKGFEAKDIDAGQHGTMNDLQALRSGFITNLFNPKATLFFLALFTQVIDPHIPMSIQALYGLTCMIMVISWFSIVATVLTTPAIRQRFLKLSKWIDRTCGGLFIALGVKLAVTKI